MNTPLSNSLRPRDFAMLLLASRDLRPRKRARDQRADTAGLDLKRSVLEKLADHDPEPGEFEAGLLRILEEIGPPLGPTRAIASMIHEEWQAACINPEWVAQLLSEAVGDKGRGGDT
ncbi:MAG: hypothetical protein HY040_11785 [Planctomycetes bacterium]|nr:hypothetical protein [Planctomycetota bacterium]